MQPTAAGQTISQDESMRGIKTNGRFLLQLRRDRGWTQQQLAKHARCDVKTLRRAEQGQPVDSHTLQVLARVFKVDFSLLVAATYSEGSEGSEHVRTIENMVHALQSRDPVGLLNCFTPKAMISLPPFPEMGFAGLKTNDRHSIRGLVEELLASALDLNLETEFACLRSSALLLLSGRSDAGLEHFRVVVELHVHKDRVSKLELYRGLHRDLRNPSKNRESSPKIP